MSIAKRDDEPASSAMNISSDPKAKHTKKSVDKAKKTNKIKAANASYCTRKEITVHDIISGRGASINQHPGNEHYRQLIKSQKLKYINSAPPVKKGIIRAIVIAVTKLQSPPGRFLKYNEENGVYEDIGILEAKKKTGQALREDAAKIRQMNAAISDFLNSSREGRAAAGARNGEEKSIVGVVQKAAVESAFNLVQRKQHESPKTPNHHNRSDIKRVNRYMTTFDDMECAVDKINRCKERIQAIAIRQNRAANPPEDRHSLSPILHPFTEEHIYNQVYTGNYCANADARSMQVPASNLAHSPMPPLFEATSRATTNVYIPQTDGGTGGAIHGNPEYEYDYAASIPAAVSNEMDPMSGLQHFRSQIHHSQEFYHPMERIAMAPLITNNSMHSSGYGPKLQQQQQQQQQQSYRSTFNPRELTDAEGLQAFASMSKDSSSRFPAYPNGTNRSASSAFRDCMNSSSKRTRRW